MKNWDSLIGAITLVSGVILLKPVFSLFSIPISDGSIKALLLLILYYFIAKNISVIKEKLKIYISREIQRQVKREVRKELRKCHINTS